ncbi:DNA-formamidopyrimidine glycosylase family protein, partial [Streptococcus sobrinus]
MPELPEVETVRRGLEKQIVGKTIESVKVTYPKLVRTGLEDFQLLLPGQSVQAMRRRGKYLIFELTGGLVISHLRMEGKYFLFSDQVPTNKHFHA